MSQKVPALPPSFYPTPIFDPVPFLRKCSRPHAFGPTKFWPAPSWPSLKRKGGDGTINLRPQTRAKNARKIGVIAKPQDHNNLTPSSLKNGRG